MKQVFLFKNLRLKKFLLRELILKFSPSMQVQPFSASSQATAPAHLPPTGSAQWKCAPTDLLQSDIVQRDGAFG